jgi:hypothetical protein
VSVGKLQNCLEIKLFIGNWRNEVDSILVYGGKGIAVSTRNLRFPFSRV